jgi:ubiquinone/menaquinone biosynthesis C-methylase UbiE
VTSVGRFDRDSAALEQRINSHDRFGSRDLNAWIFEWLPAEPGDNVLDLGCGTGKQSVPLAQSVAPTGSVVSVDVSGDSLRALQDRADEADVREVVETVNAELDDLASVLAGRHFDAVLGSYSLYYARDGRKLLESIHELLNPEGVLFFCGPTRANNDELRRFHYGLRGEHPPPDTMGAVFMETEAPRLAGQLFSSVETSRFENPLRFDSADDLYRYWASYNLYDESLDDAFRSAAGEHFRTHGEFVTVKRALGVCAVR